MLAGDEWETFRTRRVETPIASSKQCSLAYGEAFSCPHLRAAEMSTAGHTETIDAEAVNLLDLPGCHEGRGVTR